MKNYDDQQLLDSTFTDIQCYTVENFPYHIITSLPGLPRRKTDPRPKEGERPCKAVVCAFDIETTNLPQLRQAFMSVWQFAISDQYVVIGRTWHEFLEFLTKIKPLLNGQRLCIYVHNLSFEFQFLRGIYDFRPEEVFAVKSRKVLRCTMMELFEFRCSYFLTNSSLDRFTKNMRVPHRKVEKEKFNYDRIRTPGQPLGEAFPGEELRYIIYDVVGLVEAVTVKMHDAGDTLYSIPMTQTGYVRREMKKALREQTPDLRRMLPRLSTYKLLRLAFRGGDCHASRFFAGDILSGVRSFDRSSSYPDVLVNCEFPWGQFSPVDTPDMKTLEHLILRRHRAVVACVVFHGLRLKDPLWPMPYLPKAKCQRLVRGQYDNGRVLCAELASTVLTDVDLQIMLEQYEFDALEVEEAESAPYKKLPVEFTNLVLELYRKKTQLKGVQGKALEYQRSKEMLNSLYGMCAQDPVRAEICFSSDSGFEVTPPQIEFELDDYHRSGVLPYQWGVWCTAWARLRLYEAVRIAGHSTVYCDTDSVKFVGLVDFSEYNNARISDSRDIGAFAVDPSGQLHYMGVLEEETPEDGLFEFKTLGAKKYAYRETPGDDLMCTISGVPKRDGSRELDSMGGLPAFEPGTVLHDGQLGVVYNDEAYGCAVVNGENITITANACLLPDTYTIGITDEYARLLTDSRMYNFVLISEALKECENHGYIS